MFHYSLIRTEIEHNLLIMISILLRCLIILFYFASSCYVFFVLFLFVICLVWSQVHQSRTQMHGTFFYCREYIIYICSRNVKTLLRIWNEISFDVFREFHTIFSSWSTHSATSNEETFLRYFRSVLICFVYLNRQTHASVLSSAKG